MSDAGARRAMEKFQRDMKKLKLGVKIRAGDGPWTVITEPPVKRSDDAQTTKRAPARSRTDGEETDTDGTT